MTASIIDFHALLTEEQDKQAAYDTRMDQAAQCFRILAEAFDAMRALGADHQQIVNVLQVSIEEMRDSEPAA